MPAVQRAIAASEDGIYKEGTLWAMLNLKSMQQRASEGMCIKHVTRVGMSCRNTDTQQDGTLYCVGSKASGKSTVIDRFLGKSVRGWVNNRQHLESYMRVCGQTDEPYKPTESPQYTYARLPADGPTSRSKVGHIWEIAGPSPLVTRFTSDATLFLAPSRPSVVLITVDISQPSHAVLDAQQWLRLVTQRAGYTADPDSISRCRAHWDPQHPDLVAGHIQMTGMYACSLNTTCTLLL